MNELIELLVNHLSETIVSIAALLTALATWIKVRNYHSETLKKIKVEAIQAEVKAEQKAVEVRVEAEKTIVKAEDNLRQHMLDLLGQRDKRVELLEKLWQGCEQKHAELLLLYGNEKMLAAVALTELKAELALLRNNVDQLDRRKVRSLNISGNDSGAT